MTRSMRGVGKWCVLVVGMLIGWWGVVGGGVSPVLGATGRGNVDLPRYPSVSPDGSAVCFTWRGDLWKVASTGGGGDTTDQPSQQ